MGPTQTTGQQATQSQTTQHDYQRMTVYPELSFRAEDSVPLDIAMAFTRAWTSHDMRLASTYIAENVVFDGPLQQSTGAKPYLEGLARLSEMVTGMQVIAAFGDDDRALIMYDLSTDAFGKLSCAKCLTVRDGMIQRDKLVFDSHKIR